LSKTNFHMSKASATTVNAPFLTLNP
jgi:hypothetical protein